MMDLLKGSPPSQSLENFVWMAIPIVLTVVILTWTHLKIITRMSTTSWKDDDAAEETNFIHQQMQRKSIFVSRMKKYYGYSQDMENEQFIDHWRGHEFPSLIQPLVFIRRYSWHHVRHLILRFFHSHKPNVDPPTTNHKEVYLDFAGASLPTLTQWKDMYASSIQTQLQVLANPHSSGPAAARTTGEIHLIDKLILDFFDAATKNGGFLNHSINDNHPGYHIIFTSGATEALRIVAEHFPWQAEDEDVQYEDDAHDKPSRSMLLYPPNAHTSVIGMRACALQKGASFQCVPISSFIQTVHALSQNHPGNKDNDMDGQPCKSSCNLIVLPLECNFSGQRYDTLFDNLRTTIQTISHQKSPRKWYTLLDISKAASTSPIHLCKLDPDFACFSFYKLFGHPTGLGVLFVKRTCTDLLTGKTLLDNIHSSIATSSSSSRRTLSTRNKRGTYFGGGSVDAVSPFVDFVLPRSKEDYLSSLVHGTKNFRNIILLKHGFDAIARLGGMEKIYNHTHCLRVELLSRLNHLFHRNGRKAIIIYGQSTNGDTSAKPTAAAETNEDYEAAETNKDYEEASGPIVSFNILRSDGSYVGYHEVEKIAALSNPPLQFRTGCFCNPGSCQQYLGYSDQDMLHLAFEKKKVCGDHKDIIDGKPTGAIRISFGPYSLWEDLDTLITFIETYFIDKSPQATSFERTNTSEVSALSKEYTVELSEIYIFPIKSCAAMRVRTWNIDSMTGMLQYDREFAIVDSFGEALRLSSHPKLTLIEPRIDIDKQLLIVNAPSCQELVIDITRREGTVSYERDINICGSACSSTPWGNIEISDWFSSYLGVPCWLARYKNISATILNTPHYAFANEAPILLISQESVSILNRALKQQSFPNASTKHFRPNLVVHSVSISSISEDHANPEDSWISLRISRSGISFCVSGKCNRCSMVDIDPLSGMKGQTLKTLAQYRRNRGNITFGVFLSLDQDNSHSHVTDWTIHEGDNILVTIT